MRRTPIIRNLWAIRVRATDSKADADVRLTVRMPRSAALVLLTNLRVALGKK